MVGTLRRPVVDPDLESDGLDVSSLKRAAALLRESRMPPDEIRTIVTTAEPELVRRHLELHIERLEEWLAAQRRNLASVEELLATRGPFVLRPEPSSHLGISGRPTSR